MKTLIEVGAFDGSDSLRYHNEGYQVFTFEPKKDLYEDLVNRTGHLKNYTVIPKAVCFKNGKTTFNIGQSEGASSILPLKLDAGHHHPDVDNSSNSYEVETTRLDTFIEENGLQDTIIDFLHIDVQGVDFQALKSAGIYISNVLAGVVETAINEDKSIYMPQPENRLSNIKLYLETNGFKITNIESNDISQWKCTIYFNR